MLSKVLFFVCVQAQAIAGQFKSQEIANTIWAYARLRTKPPKALLSALFQGANHRLSAFKPAELSSLMWALAKLHIVPSKEWKEEFLQASYHKIGAMSPQVSTAV